MRRDRDSSWKGFAAPQALAVLSCALALLMVQPPAAQSCARAVTPIFNASSVEGSVLSRAEGENCEPARMGSAVSSSRFFFTSARRLHVLASMDILHRVLVGELRTAPRVALGGISYFWGLLCFVQPTPPASAAFQRVTQLHGLSVEWSFVRLRSQLAPPSV